jgi:erythromycin esterase-like protein
MSRLRSQMLQGAILMNREAQHILAVKNSAIALSAMDADYESLLDFIGDARFVLLGEASHGTEEFYRARAEITRRLIEQVGFGAVAVEADWPDAWRINRFVRGLGKDESAGVALGDFRRFPRWMWRNHAVADFVDYLRNHNAGLVPARQVGFYGLDLYSLHSSVAAIIAYLSEVDPAAATQAREFYGCLGDMGSLHDGRSYGRAVRIGMQSSCEDAVVRQLLQLQENAARYIAQDEVLREDAQFHAEQNARLVRNAEAYYRGSYCRGVNTWNLRDQHMTETLTALAEHLARFGEPARIVVWAHNSHIGDARVTSMGQRGDHNVGQLVRERYGKETVLVGFTTFAGSVAAADDWDEPMQTKTILPALAESYEYLFHQTGIERFLLLLRGTDVAALLDDPPRLERAIGVIYRPQTERASHYFATAIGRQFDAVIHFDRTHALRPLDGKATTETGATPETYPFGV